MPQIDWSVVELERDTATGTVQNVHWLVLASDTSGNAVNSIGVVRLGEPPEDGFIQFGDLTEDTVLGWMFERMEGDYTKEQIEDRLVEQYNDLIAPKVSKGLPW